MYILYNPNKILVALFFFVYILLNNNIFVLCQQPYQYPIDRGARCQPYIGDPPGEKICEGLLVNPSSIYVGGQYTQEQLRKNVTTLLQVLNVYGSSACKNTETYVGICTMYLKECSNVTLPNGDVIAFPNRTCRHSCSEIMSTCGLPPTDIFNCDLPEAPPGGPLFIEYYSSYNLSTISVNTTSNYTVACQDVKEAVQIIFKNGTDGGIVNAGCPKPLLEYNTTDRVYAKSIGITFTNESSNCVVNCPAPIFTYKTWKQIYLMSDILTYFSFVSSFFLVVTFGILNPKKSRYDKINLCYITSTCMICVSGLIVSFNGTEKTLCPTPYRFATFSDAPCTASAFILHIFALYGVMYWAIMAFEIWWGVKKVGGHRKDLFNYYLVGTSVVAWVLPLIAISKKQYHSGIANVFCWIDTATYQIALFWVPLGIILLVGATFMFLLMYEIYKIVSASSGSKGKNAKIEILKVEIKPITGVVLYFSMFLYLFIYTRYVQDNYDRFMAGIPDWFKCVIFSGDPYGCKVKGPNPAGVGYFIFCVRTFALVCFLLNGLSSRAFNIWANSIIFNNSFIKRVRSISSRMTSTTMSANTSKNSFPSAPSHMDSRNSLDASYSIELRDEYNSSSVANN